MVEKTEFTDARDPDISWDDVWNTIHEFMEMIEGSLLNAVEQFDNRFTTYMMKIHDEASLCKNVFQEKLNAVYRKGYIVCPMGEFREEQIDLLKEFFFPADNLHNEMVNLVVGFLLVEYNNTFFKMLCKNCNNAKDFETSL